MELVDPRSGMYTVKRSTKYEVIDVNRIKCVAHLISSMEIIYVLQRRRSQFDVLAWRSFNILKILFLNLLISNIYQYNNIYSIENIQYI